MNSSISLSDLQIDQAHSPHFDSILCGRNQDLRKIDVLYVCEKDGLSYRVCECNLKTIFDLGHFRTLLEKNLILLHTDKNEMFTFFDLKGKISQESIFKGGKTIKQYSYSPLAYYAGNGSYFGASGSYESNQISIKSFKMMDKKTSELVKKTLMDIAWWFDRVPHDQSKRQYELIPNNLPSYKIQQFAQPNFPKPTIIPPISSQNKTLSSISTKPSINISSSTSVTNTNTSFSTTNASTKPSSNVTSYSTITNTNASSSTITNAPTKPTNNATSSLITNTPLKPANNIIPSPSITNTATSLFSSLADFQGNNFEKDMKTPAQLHLKTAVDLAKKDGFTKFSISNSFDENERVQVESFIDPIFEAIKHKAKVNFYIIGSNASEKKKKLTLQRLFYTCCPDENKALSAIKETCETVKKSAIELIKI